MSLHKRAKWARRQRITDAVIGVPGAIVIIILWVIVGYEIGRFIAWPGGW